MMRGNRADVATGSRPAVPASLTADTVKLEDFRVPTASESPVAQQSTEQLLKAQQLEIARLSDQLNLLAAKVDLLQPPAAPVALGMSSRFPLGCGLACLRFPVEHKTPFPEWECRKPADRSAGAIHRQRRRRRRGPGTDLFSASLEAQAEKLAGGDRS